MRFLITCDSDWEAKIDKVLDALYDTGSKEFFDKQNYGSSLDCVAVVLMCQNPALNLRRRIRQSKKEKTIYLDIMLDLNQFLRINQKERNRIVAEKLVAEVPPIIAKYKLGDFNLSMFKSHLSKWMTKVI